MITTRLAFLAEDLSTPIDEGMKKYNHSFIEYLKTNYGDFKVYSRIIDDIAIVNKNCASKSFLSLKLLRNIRKYNPDLIIYSPLASGTLASFLRLSLLKLTCKKSKTVLINLQRRQHGSVSKMVVRLFRPDRVIIFSKRDFDYFKSINIEPIMSRTGVDLTRFSPVNSERKFSIRKKYGFLPEDTLLLHAGHINHGRNIEILQNLFSKDKRIIIVGSTSTSVDHELKENLSRNGVTVIDSYIKNIEEIYQMSDVYIFPVRNDHSAIEFPLSILEAMACNLPVVTTPYGSLTDYFKQSTSFAYFDSTQDLKNKVSDVLNHESNNRNVVAESFSWEVVFDELIEKVLSDDSLSDRY